MDPQDSVEPAPGTAWEAVGDEIVVWREVDRTLHRLDPLASWLWRSLERGLTVREAADHAAAAVGPEGADRARAETRAFVGSLERKGLIVRVTAASPAQDASLNHGG